MVNDGKPCSLQNYGIPEERGNPASRGTITLPPSNGEAVFSGPSAVYTPRPGFAGQDEFSYEAEALSRTGTPLKLKVRVLVTVSATN
jgi:hypothetical protein